MKTVNRVARLVLKLAFGKASCVVFVGTKLVVAAVSLKTATTPAEVVHSLLLAMGMLSTDVLWYSVPWLLKRSGLSLEDARRWLRFVRLPAPGASAAETAPAAGTTTIGKPEPLKAPLYACYPATEVSGDIVGGAAATWFIEEEGPRPRLLFPLDTRHSPLSNSQSLLVIRERWTPSTRGFAAKKNIGWCHYQRWYCRSVTIGGSD